METANIQKVKKATAVEILSELGIPNAGEMTTLQLEKKMNSVTALCEESTTLDDDKLLKELQKVWKHVADGGEVEIEDSDNDAATTTKKGKKGKKAANAKKGKKAESNGKASSNGKTRKDRTVLPRGEILGHSPTAIMRWCGAKGWEVEDALKVLKHFKVKFLYGPAYVYKGRQAAKTDKASILKLSKDEEKQLNAIRK